MLDAFIIEELRRREEAEREAKERPTLRLPHEIRRAPGPGPAVGEGQDPPRDPDPGTRGVIIIDF